MKYTQDFIGKNSQIASPTFVNYKSTAFINDLSFFLFNTNSLLFLYKAIQRLLNFVKAQFVLIL